METTIADLLHRLQSHDTALEDVTFGQLIGMCSLGSALKKDISQAQHIQVSRETPPAEISTTIADFLAESLGFDVPLVENLWRALRHIIWDFDARNVSDTNLSLFERNGWDKLLSKSDCLGNTALHLTRLRIPKQTIRSSLPHPTAPRPTAMEQNP